MAENKSITSDQQKTILSEKLWLSYFNNYLYENGMLTEAERNRISLRIESQNGSTSTKNTK